MEREIENEIIIGPVMVRSRTADLKSLVKVADQLLEKRWAKFKSNTEKAPPAPKNMY